MKRTYTFTDALNTERGEQLIRRIEEAESEIWGRDIDPNDENEFWAIVRRMDIESLKAEFGLEWE